MKILRTTDKVTLSAEGVSIVAQPLAFEKAIEAGKFTKVGKDGETEIDMTGLTLFTIKHSVKAVSGLEGVDGSPYSLEWEPQNTEEPAVLSDQCARDLTTVLMSVRVLLKPLFDVSGQKIPKPVNPLTNEPIPGVTIAYNVKEGDAGKPEVA